MSAAPRAAIEKLILVEPPRHTPPQLGRAGSIPEFAAFNNKKTLFRRRTIYCNLITGNWKPNTEHNFEKCLS